jgi:ATP-dependent Clp protease ATP-binding subunit ClpC
VFERFTDRARKIVGLATAEAAGRGESMADTVDLLVGMLREGGGVAWHVLAFFSSVALEAVLGARESTCAEPDVSLADVESRCRIEATWLDHHYPGTEHLLLAVCCLDKSRGARLLTQLGKQPVQVCSSVFDILGHSDDWERWLADDHPQMAPGR